jgi:hypothetical protein
MTNNQKRAAIFFATLAAFAGLAWLGGYDFNERGPVIALVAFWALYFSFEMASSLGDE